MKGASKMLLCLELLCGMCEDRVARGLRLIMIQLSIRLHHGHLVYSDILDSDVLVDYWWWLLYGFDWLTRAPVTAMVVLEAILASSSSHTRSLG